MIKDEIFIENKKTHHRQAGRPNGLFQALIASLFDTNQPLAFARTLDRLLPDIEDNRKEIIADYLSLHNNNDIMFNKNLLGTSN